MTAADWAAIHAIRVTSDDEIEEEPEEHQSPIYVLSDSDIAHIHTKMADDNDDEQKPDGYGEEPQEH